MHKLASMLKLKASLPLAILVLASNVSFMDNSIELLGAFLPNGPIMGSTRNCDIARNPIISSPGVVDSYLGPNRTASA